MWSSLCVVVANVFDCIIVVSKIKFESCYYVYFQTWKMHESLVPEHSYGLNSTINVLKGRLGIEWFTKIEMPLNRETKPTELNQTIVWIRKESK